MPRLMALRPGAIAIVVDLSYFAYRLEFASTTWDATPCFSLVYSYPASPVGTYLPPNDDPRTRQLDRWVSFADFAKVALVRLPVQFATAPAEVAKVATAANESESLEVLETRTTEAFRLFLNNARVRKDDVERTAADAVTLAKAAWGIRDWMADGMIEKKRWDMLGSSVIGQP